MMSSAIKTLVTNLHNQYSPNHHLTTVHSLWWPSQQRLLQWCFPHVFNSWHLIWQRASSLHLHENWRLPQRQVFSIMISHGGQGGGWQGRVQAWPQGRIALQDWWHEGVSSVHGMLYTSYYYTQCEQPTFSSTEASSWRFVRTRRTATRMTRKRT